MKKSRLTEEQTERILRNADRSPVLEVAKRHGISDQTIDAWRKRLGLGWVSPDPDVRAHSSKGNGRCPWL